MPAEQFDPLPPVWKSTSELSERGNSRRAGREVLICTQADERAQDLAAERHLRGIAAKEQTHIDYKRLARGRMVKTDTRTVIGNSGCNY